MEHVLIFVEDPGAANFVVGLPDILADQGLTTTLLGDGAAPGYLANRGIIVKPIVAREEIDAIFGVESMGAVVVGTSENRGSLGLELIQIAAAKDIPSIGIVDAVMNAETRFQGETDDSLAYLPDMIVLPDEKTRDRYVELGVQEDRLFIIGNPQLDSARSKALTFSTLDREEERKRHFGISDPERPIVVFLGETSDGLNPADFTRNDEYCIIGHGNSIQRTHIVLEEFLDATSELCPNALVVIRLHPKEYKNDYAAYRDEIGQWSEGGDPLEALFVADLVVGMTTSLLLECHAMGVPVLSILPREKEIEWLPGSGRREFSVALGRPEIRRQLRKAISNPSRRSAPRLEPARYAIEKFSDIILGVTRRGH